MPVHHTTKARRPFIDNGDGTVTIPLTRGYTALIDADDAPRCDYYNWAVSIAEDRPPYAFTGGRGAGSIYLHRFILNAPAGVPVDHINLDSLDCRKANLRLCTSAQNMMNVNARQGNPTGYKGVRLRCDGKRWTARIQVDGRGIHLGSFDTPEEAARAYDAKARELFGAFARTNFGVDHAA